MPRTQTYYEPDAIDCNTLVTAIGGDFGGRCEISTRYERDKVTVLVRVRKPELEGEGEVLCQALVSHALKPARNLYIMQYSALLDCWHQLDRGVLSAATRPIQYSWNGRPQAPAKRTAK